MKNEVVGGITKVDEVVGGITKVDEVVGGITRAKKKSYVYTKLIAMLIAMLKKLIVMLERVK